MKKGICKEVAPEGCERTVKAMKRHRSIDNPWALAGWLKDRGAHPDKVEEMLSRLNENTSAKALYKNIKRLLQEYDDSSHAYSMRGDGFSEAQEAEHELRKAVSEADIPGVGIHMAETGLSHETLIISIDGQEALDKEFHMLITCQGNGLYDAHLYESGKDGSRPLNVDRELDWEKLKARVLEFCEAVSELIASKKMDDLDTVSADEVDEEKIIKPEQPQRGQVSETRKRATKKILDDMLQGRINRPVSRLKENLDRTHRLLRG